MVLSCLMMRPVDADADETQAAAGQAQTVKIELTTVSSMFRDRMEQQGWHVLGDDGDILAQIIADAREERETFWQRCVKKR